MLRPKIKVAHFLSSRLETLSGGDLVILNLLKYLDKERFEPRILCFHEERNPGLPVIVKVARERNIKTHMINVKGRFDVSAVSKLGKFIEGEGIDVLHCHGYKADVVASLLKQRDPPKRVTTLHGWWIGSSPKLKFYDWLDVRAIRDFDRVITVANHIRAALLKKGFSPEKVTCIPNGVDIEEIGSCDGSKVRSELKIPSDSIVVGIAGRLSREKGHGYLLRSIAKLPDIILLIVGTGPLERELKMLADRLGIRRRTIFAGFRSDANKYIAAMDIFALPSLSEGLPLALLEAMAAGKPVVASNVGGIPKVVDGKNTGLLVEPGNISGLEQAISRLICDKGLAALLAKDGKDFVENNYSLVVATKKYEGLYYDLLKGR